MRNRTSRACHYGVSDLLITSILVLVSLASAGCGRASAGPVPLSLLDEALSDPLRSVEHLIFVVRNAHDDWWHPTRDRGGARDLGGPTELTGKSAICRLNLRSGKRDVLFEVERGDICGFDIDHAGRRLVFSLRQGGREQPYRLMELPLVSADGRPGGRGGEAVQLTAGSYDDIDPVILPDGTVVFASSRSRRWSRHGDSRVFTLYRCAADGSAVQPYSSHVEMQRGPTLLPDGRLLFAQEENVGLAGYRTTQLFAGHPDGTRYEAVCGTGALRGISLLHARPIPGSGELMAVAVPGGAVTREKGWLARVNPACGPDDPSGLRLWGQPEGRLTQVLAVGRLDQADWEPLQVEHPEFCWRYPYPLNRALTLAVRDRSICVVDDEGRYEVLFDETESAGELGEVMPWGEREREPRIPLAMHYSSYWAQVIINDVTAGQPEIQPGQVAKLLVTEELPRPVENPGGWSEPITRSGVGNLRRILGTVPVEPDGSVFFEVLPMAAVSFALLDQDDRLIQSMRSWVSFMPGERQACHGCHESRQESFGARGRLTSRAIQRAPDPLHREAGVPAMIDFVRHIQPLLDRHCVECHDGDTWPGKVMLAGDRTPVFSASYATLMDWRQIENALTHGSDVPWSRGSAASPLVEKFEGGHQDVRATEEELRLVKRWIDVGAPFVGTYAADHPARLWSFSEWRPERMGHAIGTERMLPADIEVIQRRCTPCHGEGGENFVFGSFRQWPFGGKPAHLGGGSDRYINLDRPTLSPLVLAPLDRSAGGWGVCRNEEGEVVFEDRHDPDYVRLDASLLAAADHLRARKRFDMAGFVPSPLYSQRMREFGVLKSGEAPGPGMPTFDPYRLDQKYLGLFGRFYIFFADGD